MALELLFLLATAASSLPPLAPSLAAITHTHTHTHTHTLSPSSFAEFRRCAGHAEIQADNDEDEDLASTSSEGEVDNLSEASGD